MAKKYTITLEISDNSDINFILKKISEISEVEKIKLNGSPRIRTMKWMKKIEEKNKISQEKFIEIIFNAIMGGRCGFKNGWLSSMAIDKELKKLNLKFSKNLRRDTLCLMGYRLHPDLPDGRVNNYSVIDAGKPRLYIAGDIATGLSPAEVLRQYEKDQG